MRVTKTGVIPSEREWSGKCHRCGTEATAKESELVVTDDQRHGRFGAALCPVCGNLRMIFFLKKDGAS